MEPRPEIITGTFGMPDFTAPTDVDARVATCPPNVTVKGLFVEPIAARTRATSTPVGRPRYLPFRDYPLTEWLELLPQAAKVLYPEEPVREGIRRFGWGAADGFRRGTVGGVLFGLAGWNFELAVPLVARSYEVVGSHGRVSLLEHQPGRAVFAFRGFWDWIDAWHFGVLEGALRLFRRDGEVRIRTAGPYDADFELRWS